MKKIFLYVLLFLPFLTLSVKVVKAQGTFECVCIKDQFGNCTTWDITSPKCDSDHEPNPNSCKLDAQVLPCVKSSDVKQVGWGEVCEPNNSGSKCSNENTKCRRGEDNSYRCLFPSDFVGLDGSCKDTTECVGYSNVGFNSRCGNKAGSGDSVCQTTAKPGGELCVETGGASCKKSCSSDEHQVSKAIDCKDSTPICCAPNKDNPNTPGIIGVVGITCTPTSINSAIGCIPFVDTNKLAEFFLKWGIGIGSGIAFLLIVYAGFMIMTSAANPQRLKAGQELLTAAITGLIMLIFSVFILRAIGVDILKVPGLK